MYRVDVRTMGTTDAHDLSDKTASLPQVPAMDVRQAYDPLVAQSLRSICISLAGVYALVAISHALAIFEPGSTLLSISAVVTIVFLLSLPYVIRRWAIPDEWSHVCGASIVAVVVGNVLLRFFVLKNSLYTIDIVLCVIGTGGLFLSARWLIGALLFILMSWIVAAALLFPATLLSHEALVIVAATVLAILIHHVRRRNVQEFEWLRHQEHTQRKTLEQTIEKLHQSEAHYRNLFDNANDGIVSFTLDGTFTSVNRGVVELLGRPVEDLLGRTYQDFASPEFWRQGEERTRKVLAGERISAFFTGDLLHADGSTVPVEARARFVYDKNGHPIGI